MGFPDGWSNVARPSCYLLHVSSLHSLSTAVEICRGHRWRAHGVVNVRVQVSLLRRGFDHRSLKTGQLLRRRPRLALSTNLLRIRNTRRFVRLLLRGRHQLLLESRLDHLLDFRRHVLLILSDGFIDSELHLAVQSLLLQLDLVVHHLVDGIDQVFVLLFLYLLRHHFLRFRSDLRLQWLELPSDHVIDLLLEGLVQAHASSARFLEG